MTPAKRSPDGFVASRLPAAFDSPGATGPWIVLGINGGGLCVEAFTDEQVTDWPDLLDEPMG